MSNRRRIEPASASRVTLRTARAMTDLATATGTGLLLEQITRAVRAGMLTAFHPESCIATTRAVIDAAAYFGVQVSPVAVTLRADSADGHYQLVIKSGGDIPSPGRWNGHLIGLAGTWLADGSLDQFDRPAKGIHLSGPLVAELPGPWPPGAALRLVALDGTRLTYTRLADASWRTSRDWSARRADIRRITAAAIREVRDHA